MSASILCLTSGPMTISAQRGTPHLPRAHWCRGPEVKTQKCMHLVIKSKFKKFYLKSVHFITVQHKLSRAFQSNMHNKLHKLNTAQ
jgi:hypothetical protein